VSVRVRKWVGVRERKKKKKTAEGRQNCTLPGCPSTHKRGVAADYDDQSGGDGLIRTVLGALAGRLVLHGSAGHLASVGSAAEEAHRLPATPSTVRAVAEAL
jgi:hypothetical protein